MNDQTYILCARDDPYVKVCAEGIVVGWANQAVIIVSRIFRRIVEGIDRPTAVVIVGAVIVNAHIPWENRSRVAEVWRRIVELADP